MTVNLAERGDNSSSGLVSFNLAYNDGDALYVANEGKLLALVSSEAAESLIRRMRENPYGREACIIGEAKREAQGIVAMRTGGGGTRIVDMLVGEQLPRIC